MTNVVQSVIDSMRGMYPGQLPPGANGLQPPQGPAGQAIASQTPLLQVNSIDNMPGMSPGAAPRGLAGYPGQMAPPVSFAQQPVQFPAAAPGPAPGTFGYARDRAFDQAGGESGQGNYAAAAGSALRGVGAAIPAAAVSAYQSVADSATRPIPQRHDPLVPIAQEFWRGLTGAQTASPGQPAPTNADVVMSAIKATPRSFGDPAPYSPLSPGNSLNNTQTIYQPGFVHDRQRQYEASRASEMDNSGDFRPLDAWTTTRPVVQDARAAPGGPVPSSQDMFAAPQAGAGGPLYNSAQVKPPSPMFPNPWAEGYSPYKSGAPTGRDPFDRVEGQSASPSERAYVEKNGLPMGTIVAALGGQQHQGVPGQRQDPYSGKWYTPGEVKSIGPQGMTMWSPAEMQRLGKMGNPQIGGALLPPQGGGQQRTVAQQAVAAQQPMSDREAALQSLPPQLSGLIRAGHFSRDQVAHMVGSFAPQMMHERDPVWVGKNASANAMAGMANLTAHGVTEDKNGNVVVDPRTLQLPADRLKALGADPANGDVAAQLIYQYNVHKRTNSIWSQFFNSIIPLMQQGQGQGQ